jgi:hypothetical protein
MLGSASTSESASKCWGLRSRLDEAAHVSGLLSLWEAIKMTPAVAVAAGVGAAGAAVASKLVTRV